MNRFNRNKILQTLSIIPLIVAVDAHAYAADSDDNDNIDEIVVYGKDFTVDGGSSGTKTNIPLIETPQSLSVISRDLLDSWNTRKLTEALRYTPGVNAEPFGIEPRFTSLSLRGFGATSEGLFRDGMIMLNPFFVVSYNLEPYGAERVEIPRGPASVLYGQGSPGGLVNYISKEAKSEAFGEIGGLVGNRNRFEGQVDVNTPLTDDGSVALRVTGLIRDSDTQIDFVEEDREFVAASLKWDISDRTRLSVFGNFQQDNTKNSQALPADGTLLPNPHGEVPVSLFTGEPSLDVVDRTEYSIGYQFTHEFDEDMKFVQKLRFNEVDLDDIVVFSFGLDADQRTIQRGAFASFGHLKVLTTDNQFHAKLHTGGIEHQILAGVDYTRASGTKSNAYNGAPPGLDVFEPVYGVDITIPDPYEDNTLKIRSLGLYLQDHISLTDNLKANLAIRYDDAHSETFSLLSNTAVQDQDDSEVSLRGGLVYMMDSGFAPYISYAESFLPSTGVDGQGNPFDAETATQYEAGIKYQPDSFDGLFTVAIFKLNRKNIVDRDNNFVFFQTGEAASKGLEAEAYVSLDSGLSVIANYNYLDTEVIDHPTPEFEGKAFTQIPTHKASIWADYNFPGELSGLGVGAGVRYQSKTFSDDLNTVTSPGYTLMDAAVHYQWNNVRFSINAQNLFNKKYTSSCFTRNSLLCTFGELRAIRAMITYRWGER